MTVINSLKPLLENPETILGLDAHGVIHNGQKIIPSVYDVIKFCETNSNPYMMLTNNSLQSTIEISKTMATLGLPFSTQQIISSGCGCYVLDNLKSIISKKKVFVYGYESSQFYPKQAGGIITDNVEDSECIILAASLSCNNHIVYRNVYKTIKKNPLIPVICINPDHYVLHLNKIYPVMGYYAQQLEIQLASKWIWMGKPFTSFSELVKKIFDHQNLNYNQLLFCDDNPHNVIKIVNDLNCTGCIITDTGVFSRYSNCTINHPNIFQISACKL